MTRWAAIVGARGAGKSTHAAQVAQRLQQLGVRVGGFLQEAHENELEQRSYDLVRFGSGERLALARPGGGNQEVDGRTSYCSYSFSDDAFAAAHGWLREDLQQAAQVIIIDEVSKMEAAGQGHYEAIRTSMADDASITLLSIRADQLFYVVEKLGLEDDPVGVLEIPAEAEELDAFAALLTKDVAEHRKA